MTGRVARGQGVIGLPEGHILEGALKSSKMTLKITHVEARPGHRLRVGFENGETRLFDVTPYLDKGVFRELRDEAYFQRVRPVWGGVEWPHEQDLSADTLYCSGTPLTSSRSVTSSRRDDRAHQPAARHAARADRQ